MGTLFVILTGLLLLQSLISLLACFRLARYALAPRGARPSRNQLRAAIILPCRGLEPDFEANIRAFLTQDYREYEILFVVESQQDPAYAALTQIIKQSRRNAWLLIAGEAHNCGQKVHNLLFALDTLDANDRRVEVLAFADADARPHATWLAELVAPLNDRSVGATTGFRWYVPERGGFASWLTSAWNASALSLLGERSGFAWGGSMAILRENFTRLKIKQRWRGAVSDDYVLTAALQETGQRIKFIPQCLVATHADTTLAQLLEFSTRQLKITRVYAPHVWQLTALSNLLFNFTIWGSAMWLAWRAGQGQFKPALAVGWLTILSLGALTSWMRASIAANLLPEVRATLLAHRWRYALCAPLVPLIYLYNVIASAFSRRIVWRGIGYEMITPDTTHVWQRTPLQPAPKANERAPRKQKAQVRSPK
jgi:cellulose synthase/poly-beta-1,6-N-acetylglucosamine synthase-like glycosyltransferase